MVRWVYTGQVIWTAVGRCFGKDPMYATIDPKHGSLVCGSRKAAKMFISENSELKVWWTTKLALILYPFSSFKISFPVNFKINFNRVIRDSEISYNIYSSGKTDHVTCLNNESPPAKVFLNQSHKRFIYFIARICFHSTSRSDLKKFS